MLPGLVPIEDRVSGPGTTPIMAAFTHLNPEGSRFSDGLFGLYYCSQRLETAWAEVRYHRERFLGHTHESRYPSRFGSTSPTSMPGLSMCVS